MSDRTLKIGLVVAFALMTFLRFFDLRADNPTNIDFSLGQFTDETYYTMNARNQVLFGKPNLDEFNNMLMSPLLHLVHLANFSVFGVGAVQARSVSAVFGLLTVLCLFWGLNQAFGLIVAALGALFLGFDHIFLLFNREALMDTPSCFPAALAFGCFAAGVKSIKGFWWLAACGLCVAAAVITRSQQAPLLFVPFLALAYARRPWSEQRAALLGVSAGLAAYVLIWFLPHKAEIVHINDYFRRTLWGPTSMRDVARNVGAALFRADFNRADVPTGAVGYFSVSSLWLMVGAVVGLFAATGLRRERAAVPQTDIEDDVPTKSAAAAFLAFYLILELAAFAVVSSTPSRYMMIMLPPMAGLAAIGLMRLPLVAETLKGSAIARMIGALAITLIAFHAVVAWVPIERRAVHALVAVVLGGAAAGLFVSALQGERVRRLAAPALGLCLLLNAYWLGQWASHRTHGQVEAAAWANANIPHDAVMVNGVWLGLDSRFHALSVLSAMERKHDNPKELSLSNTDHPLQRFSDHPLYLVWPHVEPEGPPKEYGGDIIESAKLLHSQDVVGHQVDIYRITVHP